MFKIDGNRISISRGDTALMAIEAQGVTLDDNDRAIFSIKTGDGTVFFQMTLTPKNNRVEIPFINADTQEWFKGSYLWDIRYVIDAIYDSTGAVVDGKEVITPVKPSTFEVYEVVGEV